MYNKRRRYTYGRRTKEYIIIIGLRAQNVPKAISSSHCSSTLQWCTLGQYLRTHTHTHTHIYIYDKRGVSNALEWDKTYYLLKKERISKCGFGSSSKISYKNPDEYIYTNTLEIGRKR